MYYLHGFFDDAPLENKHANTSITIIQYSVHIYKHDWQGAKENIPFTLMALAVCLLVKNPARFKIIKHTLQLEILKKNNKRNAKQ